MQVLLSAPRGFCAGVVRAIEIVEIALERHGAPLFVRHEIVHNRYVVETLRRKGAVFVDDLGQVPDGAPVIFSAHGVAPSVWADAERRGLEVIDATCPLVTKVHVESQGYAREGYAVIVVGHEGHPEVEGTLGQSPEVSQLVATVEEAEQVEVPDPSRVVALQQTTLSVADTSDVLAVLTRRFPAMVVRNDICYATSNRQDATRALARRVDIVLVIGAENSPNCNRRREGAAREGVGIGGGLVEHRIDQQALAAPAAGQKGGVGARGAVEKLPEQHVMLRSSGDRETLAERATIVTPAPAPPRSAPGRRPWRRRRGRAHSPDGR